MDITPKTIVTHSGPFHADDVVACALVRRHFNSGWDIIRTRDPKALEQAKNVGAVLIDVGGEYNPNRNLFDHHFRNSPQRGDGSLYASAGMVAREIWDLPGWLMEFCKKVDLADTGSKVPGWTFSQVVHQCNPVDGNLEAFDTRFELLVSEVHDLLGVVDSAEEFESRFLVAFSAFVREHLAHMSASERRVREAFKQEGASYLEFSRYEPALADIAWEASEDKLYTIYPSPGGEWMVQQIPVEKGGFAGRKSLPAEWAGLRGADLDAVTGVEGCVFCHPGRFIGGHKTLEGARKLALLAAQA